MFVGLIGLIVATAACGTPPAHYTAATEVVLHASIVSSTTPDLNTYVADYTTSTGPHGASNCRVAATRGNSALQTFVVAGPGTKRAPLDFAFQARPFTGPGAYSGNHVRIDSVAAVIDRESLEFRRQPASDVSITIAPDGSGVAHFSGFRSVHGTSLSASVTWRCATRTVKVPA